ncbi:serine-threonine/tyrosine-protein kinase catalytic domain-containing protein, partial [Tanacetum coccineum]
MELVFLEMVMAITGCLDPLTMIGDSGRFHSIISESFGITISHVPVERAQALAAAQGLASKIDAIGTKQFHIYVYHFSLCNVTLEVSGDRRCNELCWNYLINWMVSVVISILSMGWGAIPTFVPAAASPNACAFFTNTPAAVLEELEYIMSIIKNWEYLKIPFEKIDVATEKFKTRIGGGGYGVVYKGVLSIDGKDTAVAVKRLNEQFGQGLKEFLTEIQLLFGQEHPNLISLVGYCNDENENIIVYEYAAPRSLDRYIRHNNRDKSSITLTWLERLKICADVARGLDHLHNHLGGHRMIIHMDIKSSNILIDENWVAKMSDLGLSKLGVTGL